MYRIIQTEEFEKEFNKLPALIQKKFKKQIEKVAENPYAVGKKLRVYDWLRELKTDKYRLYYLIYGD